MEKVVKKEKKSVTRPKEQKLGFQRPVYKIDATEKVLGRLATEVAILLRGKNKASYLPYLDKGGEVIIKNVAKIKTTGRKLFQKQYYHYSGYPSGLKIKKMSDLMVQKPAEVLKKAVWNMLPKNKLRDKMIKRLKISN